MKLDDIYSVKRDGAGWTLTKEEVTGRINTKTGKNIVSRDVWHYPTFKLCLNTYIDQSLCDDKNVLQLLDELKRIEDNINNVI